MLDPTLDSHIENIKKVSFKLSDIVNIIVERKRFIENTGKISYLFDVGDGVFYYFVEVEKNGENYKRGPFFSTELEKVKISKKGKK